MGSANQYLQWNNSNTENLKYLINNLGVFVVNQELMLVLLIEIVTYQVEKTLLRAF
jgi:hypothetical protein